MLSSTRKATAIDWIRFLLAALIGVAIVTFAAASASQSTDAPHFDGIGPSAGQDGVAMSVKKRAKVEKPMKAPGAIIRRRYQIKDTAPIPSEIRQRKPQLYDGLWDEPQIEFMLRTVA